MSRRRRERAIAEITGNRIVRTQSELVEALRERGIEVTQSTVSRDIKRLGLVKVPTREGGYRYAPPGAVGGSAPAAEEELREAFAEFATGVDTGAALVAIATPPGSADPVAVAIDRADLDGVVATLAGDDTVFVLVREERDRDRLLRTFGEWIAG